ncbi:MAG: hypothetical protein ABFD50_18920 [Smithella sp.]
MYRLKPNIPNFRVTDGPYAGRLYEAGKQYQEEDIPPQETHKFEPVCETIDASQETFPGNGEMKEGGTEN